MPGGECRPYLTQMPGTAGRMLVIFAGIEVRIAGKLSGTGSYAGVLPSGRLIGRRPALVCAVELVRSALEAAPSRQS
jgi:hypothetical protein